MTKAGEQAGGTKTRSFSISVTRRVFFNLFFFSFVLGSKYLKIFFAYSKKYH